MFTVVSAGAMKYDAMHGFFRRTDEEMRAAALLVFCDPLPARCSLLQQLSGREWRRLLHWLDTSGLALYLLDRVLELRRSELLPSAVLVRLEENLIDNTERTRAMIVESNAIHREFQEARLSYTVLKGFSLWPNSVPNPCLRSQLDLDFLIAESSASAARQILERRGYYLHAVSGGTLEFKTHHMPGGSLKDLYKAVPARCVELHIEASGENQSSLLTRKHELEFHGISMPVLFPVDLFLGQAQHLYKHICSEFSRAAHFVEFRRHVVVRHYDEAFWKEVRAVGEKNPTTPLALGVAILLITQVMGDFAPEILTCWTVDCLPASARLWVELYSRRCALGDFPGNKLYLLLQRELEIAEVRPKRTRWRALIPLSLPPAIVHGTSNESMMGRVCRYRLQTRMLHLRLRFHTLEGLRYLYESFRWRQRKSRLVL